MPVFPKISCLFLCAAVLAGCVMDPRLNNKTLYLTETGGVVALPEQDRQIAAVRNDFGRAESYWDGDAVSGKPSIVIKLHEQRAYFYKGTQLVGVSAISTGREGFGTPTGNFKIIQKDRHHVSSRFGDYVDAYGNIVKRDADRLKDPLPKGARYDGAKMPFFMRIVGGTGMHQGFLPGVPASHGCIRMPDFMAEAFFRNVEMGTPVKVLP